MLHRWRDGVPYRVHERPAALSNDVSVQQSISATSSIDQELLSPTALKRQRSLADVEGEDSSENQRKKRRLRLELITSRLSRPYASPNTNIVSRSAVGVGIWPQPPLLEEVPTAKAAILNSIRRDSTASTEPVERELNLHRATSSLTSPTSMDVDFMPERNPQCGDLGFARAPPSMEPEVGVCPSVPYTPNYDIFDEEDDFDEVDDNFAEQTDAYMAFEEDSDSEIYDTLCPFDEVLIEHHQKSPIDSKPENGAIAKEIQFQMPSERLGSEPFF